MLLAGALKRYNEEPPLIKHGDIDMTQMSMMIGLVIMIGMMKIVRKIK